MNIINRLTTRAIQSAGYAAGYAQVKGQHLGTKVIETVKATPSVAGGVVAEFQKARDAALKG